MKALKLALVAVLIAMGGFIFAQGRAYANNRGSKGSINALFSVSGFRQVYFSKGNLNTEP